MDLFIYFLKVNFIIGRQKKAACVTHNAIYLSNFLQY